MKTPLFDEGALRRRPSAYVTQRPSGEKSALVGADDRTPPNWDICSVGKRQAEQDVASAFLLGEEQMLAVRGPGLWHMGRTLWRRREPLDLAPAIGALREDAQVALAVRLKCNPQAVGRPDRIPVPSLQRQPAHRAGAGEIVDPDVGLLTAVDADSEARAVARDARMSVVPRRQLQRHRHTISIGQHERPEIRGRVCRSGDVHQRSRFRHGELGCPGGFSRHRAPDTHKDGHGRTSNRLGQRVERERRTVSPTPHRSGGPTERTGRRFRR